MMWVVFNTETSQIYGKFYLKQQAKDFVKYDLYWASGKNVALDKVDMSKYDKWKMWKVLNSKDLS
jgi:hypothetical protein